MATTVSSKNEQVIKYHKMKSECQIAEARSEKSEAPAEARSRRAAKHNDTGTPESHCDLVSSLQPKGSQVRNEYLETRSQLGDIPSEQMRCLTGDIGRHRTRARWRIADKTSEATSGSSTVPVRSTTTKTTTSKVINLINNLLPIVPRKTSLLCHLIMSILLISSLLLLVPSFCLAFSSSTSDQSIESIESARQHQHFNNRNQQQQPQQEYQLQDHEHQHQNLHHHNNQQTQLSQQQQQQHNQRNQLQAYQPQAQQQQQNSFEDEGQYEEDELLPVEAPYVPTRREPSGGGGGMANQLLAMASLLNSSSLVMGRDQSKSRALLPLDSSRLLLPQMQQIKSRFNQGCVGGTKCQFFAFCWMSGGSLGASCGLLMTCCVTPSRQEIQPGFYGPVVNDPYCGRSTNKISRIVGGTDASFGQFPWQAFVQVGGSRCGGALISSRHVVTAGHCVARSQHSPSSIKVTLGDYILNSDIESIPHEIFSVVEVLLHPNFRFTPQADRYDVAVLELDRQASYKDNIKPICLPQKDATFVGRVAYVAGWGALQAGSKLRPKVLQHVAVPVIENHVCEGWHRRKGIDIRIYDEMMCAGYELGQRDACQGDSGGPLMLNQFGVWYLVGIVSAGYSCAKQYQPGIYHRVSSSSDWISSNVYQQQQAAASSAGGGGGGGGGNR